MKTLRKQQRGINSISTGRWTAYAAAAAATSFAAGHTAEATIHYSGIIRENLGKYCVGTQSARFQLDQPGDSIRLRHSWQLTSCSDSYGGTAHFGVIGAGNGFAGF